MGVSLTVVPEVLRSVDVVNQSGLYGFVRTNFAGDTTLYSFNHWLRLSDKLLFLPDFDFYVFFVVGYLTEYKK